jgi:hypothetical protein
MFISSASKPKYIHEEHPLRVRGTPEYNPLYDAFQSDVIQSQRQNDFRPITPVPPPPPRFIQHFHDDIENTYDKPRSYRSDNEQKRHTNSSATNGQRPRSSRCGKKCGET